MYFCRYQVPDAALVRLISSKVVVATTQQAKDDRAVLSTLLEKKQSAAIESSTQFMSTDFKSAVLAIVTPTADEDRAANKITADQDRAAVLAAIANQGEAIQASLEAMKADLKAHQEMYMQGLMNSASTFIVTSPNDAQSASTNSLSNQVEEVQWEMGAARTVEAGYCRLRVFAMC